MISIVFMHSVHTCNQPTCTITLRYLRIHYSTAHARAQASILAGIPITAGNGETGIMWNVQGAVKRIYNINNENSAWMNVPYGERIYLLLRSIAWQSNIGRPIGTNLLMLLNVHLQRFPDFNFERYDTRYRAACIRHGGDGGAAIGIAGLQQALRLGQ